MSDTIPILLTTAISYTNGSPHIGHLYEAILADFIKRVYEITGHKVKLLTGTDEHGKKIQEVAQAKGITPIELCNHYSNEFVQMNNKIGSSYDYFIRTTEPAHLELVSNSIKQILLSNQDINLDSSPNSDSNPIYLGEYSGYYNVREECFITQTQALQTNFIDPMTSKPYEIVKEPTYFFTLSKYLNDISNTISQIIPQSFQEEIKSRLEKGLEDLSITRTTFSWGISFPEIVQDKQDKQDKQEIEQILTNSHVIYVWFDALLNYVTGKNILYGESSQVEPIHLIGKDILWFHSVIYPAILKACEYSNMLPSKILTHGFVLDRNGVKMSKSLGNVITIDELMRTYSIEAIRYYICAGTMLGHDFKFDSDNLINYYNNILIKNFGNLFQRLLKIIKPIQNEFNEMCKKEEKMNIIQDKKIFHSERLRNGFLTNFDFAEYNSKLNEMIGELNKILTEKKPWSIANIDLQLEIMFEIMSDFNIIMCLLYAIIPSKIIELSNHFGWTNKINLTIYDIELNIPETTNKVIAFEQIKTKN